MYRLFSAICLLILILPTAALAQYRETTITYLKGQRYAVKTIVCRNSTPGILIRRNQNQTFTPYRKRIAEFKRRGVAGRRIKELQSILKAGKPACRTAPPSMPTGNFDGFGNVTDAGKQNFQIPSWLSANIGDGRAVYQSNCADCHGERLSWTFPDLRNRIKLEPMFFTEEDISDAELANLTAFYNRFNPLGPP